MNERFPLGAGSEWVQAIDGITDLVSVHDRESRIVQVNRALAEFLGLPPERIIGRYCHEVFHALCESGADCPHRRALKERRAVTEEADVPEIGIPLRVTAIPLFDASGEVAGSIHIARDISREWESERKYRALFDNADDAIFLVAAGAGEGGPGRFLDVNRVACERYGYSREGLLSRSPRDLAPPERRDELAAMAGRLQAERRVTFEWEHVTSDGRRIPVEINANLFELGGRPVVLAVARDISKRKALEAERQRAAAELQTIFDSVPFGISYLDRDYVVRTANRFLYELTGLEPAGLVGRPCYETVGELADDPDRNGRDQVCGFCNIEQARAAGEPQVMERPLGDRRLRVTTVPEPGEDGSPHGFLEVVEDVTEQRALEARLQMLAGVFTHAREGITITDLDGTIVEVNDAFTRITGYPREEVVGRNPRVLKSGQQGREFYAAMWRDLTEKGHWYGEIWNRRKDGAFYAEFLTITAVCDQNGVPQHYMALFSDITAQKEHARQLEHIAHYDALTDLPNRVLLADRMHQAMAQARRRGQLLAVAYLDLDGFKAVNDVHGHEVGDQLLVVVAGRIQHALRESDTAARLGGDEFVALLVDLEGVNACVPVLTRLLAAASQPVHVGDLVLQVSASVGVTFYPQGDEDVVADQLLRQADQAMYQAKLAGKNRYHIFDADHDRNVRGYHESLERIRQALAEGELTVYYQPKVNMRSGRVTGAEALLRWAHPERGVLAPGAFLPVIDDHPLAAEVDEWVIDTVLGQLEAWQEVGLQVPVSVNISGYLLQQPDFVERLRGHLGAHPAVRPRGLELEVLETSALEDMEHVSTVMHACREMEVDFAIDDFGTGYSSLTYLKRLPAARLKIDRSFVRDMLDDPEDLSILEGVLGLATAFRIETVAEGVETVAHGELLLQLGCECAQGFTIARPMPPAELPDWVAAWRPDPAWLDQAPVSRDDLPLLFAAVEHRAWVRAVEAYVSGERTVPPPLDHHECRFGCWLMGDGAARYGGRTAFPRVEALHREVHVLVAGLLELCLEGRREEALGRIERLHALRDSLLGELRVLVTDVQAGNADCVSGRGA